MATLSEYLDSIIAQAGELKTKLDGVPEKDVAPILQKADDDLDSLLMWADDGWKKD